VGLQNQGTYDIRETETSTEKGYAGPNTHTEKETKDVKRTEERMKKSFKNVRRKNAHQQELQR